MIDFSNIEGYYGPLQVEDLDAAVAMALNPDSAPDATHTSNLITSAAVAGVRSDIASINITGTTNDTGATIPAGTYFYLSGSLVVAKSAILDGATLTEGANYEAVTAGGLNSLKSIMLRGKAIGVIGSGKTTGTISLANSVTHLLVFTTGTVAKCAMIIVATNSSSDVYVAEVYKGNDISFSAGSGTMTVTKSTSTNNVNVIDIPLTPDGTGFATLSVS